MLKTSWDLQEISGLLEKYSEFPRKFSKLPGKFSGLSQDFLKKVFGLPGNFPELSGKFLDFLGSCYDILEGLKASWERLEDSLRSFEQCLGKAQYFLKNSQNLLLSFQDFFKTEELKNIPGNNLGFLRKYQDFLFLGTSQNFLKCQDILEDLKASWESLRAHWEDFWTPGKVSGLLEKFSRHSGKRSTIPGISQ